MQINLPSPVRTALSLLSKSGFEAYAVGGCIRDSLLGLSPYDWDITTSARPEETKSVFKNFRTIDTGIKHGTVTVIIDSMHLEITTYRIDGEYKDSRHPENVTFSRSLADDLARRDFTVNTLCYNEEKGLIDLTGGLSDLNHQVLRCVGDPNLRFLEDALRILRGVRFASTLDFKIEKNTAQAMLQQKELLLNIAAERIQIEFVKLLCGKNAANVIREYHEILEVFIPELTPLIGCAQHTKYHRFDVFNHTLCTLENIDATEKLRLTMFFHDFGKPQAKTTDAFGVSHFKGHAKISAVLVHDILRRLKFDSKTVKTVTDLVLIHDTKSPKTKVDAKKLLNRIGATNYLDLIKIKRADCRGKADPYAIDEKLIQMQYFFDEIQKNQECYTLKGLQVNGNDLKSIGIVEGTQIRNSLDFLLNAVIEEKCENEKSALLKCLKDASDSICSIDK